MIAAAGFRIDDGVRDLVEPIVTGDPADQVGPPVAVDVPHTVNGAPEPIASGRRRGCKPAPSAWRRNNRV